MKTRTAKSLLALCMLAALADAQSLSSAQLAKAGELAFQIPGQGEKLLSAYRGQVISLEFIHTTCVYCQKASQVQKSLQEEFGSRGFQAIDIAINPNADLLVDNFRKDFGLNFPVGWTNEKQALAFLGYPNSDGRYLIPQIVVIDRNGYIRAKTSLDGDDPQKDSIRDAATLKNLIAALLSNSRPTHRTQRPAK